MMKLVKKQKNFSAAYKKDKLPYNQERVAVKVKYHLTGPICVSEFRAKDALNTNK